MQNSRAFFQLSRLGLVVALLGATLAGIGRSANADLVEGFDDYTTLAPAGWSFQNLSTPTGTFTWGQGNPTVFASQSGASNSYMSVNFQSTSGVGTINNWALTPTTTFDNGYVFSFYARSAGTYADRLRVSYSTNGASTNVSDFTNSLVTINSALTPSGFPTVWTKYTFTLSGLTGPITGRFGFNYNVTNGGPDGANSNFVGIDTLSLTATPPPPPTPPTSTPVTFTSAPSGTVTGAATGTHAASTIDWFTFNYTGGAITIDTLGSSFDTEIGLYNALGDLIGTNDDINYPSIPQSSLSFTNGTLAAGQYYLALGGYNSTFAGGFGAVGGVATGSYRVNITVVPETNSGILIVLAGIPALGVILRRRMRA